MLTQVELNEFPVGAAGPLIRRANSIRLPIWVSRGGEKSARPAANVGQLINWQLRSDIKGRGVTNTAQFTPTFLSPLAEQKRSLIMGERNPFFSNPACSTEGQSG